MKNIIIPSLLFLAACGGTPEVVSSEAASATTTTVAETTTTVALTTTTQSAPPETRPIITAPTEPDMNGYQPDVFLSMVERDIWYWNISYTDDVLVSLGNLSCQALDEGQEVEDYLVTFYLMATEQDPTLGEDVGLFLRYAIKYLCPEHFGQIEAYNN